MEQIVANPYQVGGMIRDSAKFVGRQREIREILGCVANLGSLSVIGERRIGKSSLLRQIVKTGRQRLSDPAATHEFFYLNMQPIESAEEFYRCACEEIAGAAAQPGDADQERVYTKYDLKIAIADRKVVLCLDEFEQAIDADFGAEFFHVLRDLAQSNHLALVVATQLPLSQIYQQHEELTSGFPNIFVQLRLGELTPDEARELVAMPRNGFRFNEEEIENILKIAGNHPYWLNCACAKAYEARRAGKTDFGEIKSGLNEVRKLYQSTVGPDFELPTIQSSSTGKWHSGRRDPNAPLRQALILILIALAIGGFSALASNLLGMILAFILLAASLLLVLLQAFK